jgi:hypothetical protein
MLRCARWYCAEGGGDRPRPPARRPQWRVVPRVGSPAERCPGGSSPAVVAAAAAPPMTQAKQLLGGALRPVHAGRRARATAGPVGRSAPTARGAWQSRPCRQRRRPAQRYSTRAGPPRSSRPQPWLSRCRPGPRPLSCWGAPPRLASSSSSVAVAVAVAAAAVAAAEDGTLEAMPVAPTAALLPLPHPRAAAETPQRLRQAGREVRHPRRRRRRRRCQPMHRLGAARPPSWHRLGAARPRRHREPRRCLRY